MTVVTVFCLLTDPSIGMPQPIQPKDLNNKKQYQLDNRYHKYIVDEALLTEDIRLRLNHDVHLIVEPPLGHRENCINIKGIQDMYHFRSVKGEPGIVYTREDMCFCAQCILGQYDYCLTNSIWKRTIVKVNLTKDVNYIYSIARFYHVYNWCTYTYYKIRKDIIHKILP